MRQLGVLKPAEKLSSIIQQFEDGDQAIQVIWRERDAEPVFPRGTHMIDDAESTGFYIVGPEESAIFLSGSKSGAVDIPSYHDVCVLICIF